LEKSEQCRQTLADDPLVVGEHEGSHAGSPQLDPEPRLRRAGGQPAAEQLCALAHSGEPVARAVFRRFDQRAKVLDGETRTGRLVRESQLDPCGGRMLADVRQRLLRGAEEGEPGVRVEDVRVAVDDKGGRNPGVVLEVGDKAGEQLRPRQLAVAEHPDRASCLFDAVAGELVRALERLDQALVVVARSAQPRSLELKRKGGEGVREDVVHLAREPLPLAEDRLRLGVARLLEFEQKPLRLVLPFRQAASEPRDGEERDHADLLHRRAERALVPAQHLGDRQGNEREADDSHP
jgi:hypothetical protein